MIYYIIIVITDNIYADYRQKSCYHNDVCFGMCAVHYIKGCNYEIQEIWEAPFSINVIYYSITKGDH